MGIIPPTHHPKTTCGWIVSLCSYLSIWQISDYKKGRVFGGSCKMNIRLASSTCTTIYFYWLILQIHPISISKRKGWDAPLPSNTCFSTEKNTPLILIFYNIPSFQTSTKQTLKTYTRDSFWTPPCIPNEQKNIKKKKTWGSALPTPPSRKALPNIPRNLQWDLQWRSLRADSSSFPHLIHSHLAESAEKLVTPTSPATYPPQKWGFTKALLKKTTG